MKYNKNTSERILEAAFSEFEEKGYYGARMQAIADKAGMNKALLHYYFKSKDALFELVVAQALRLVIPKVLGSFDEKLNILEIIKRFIAVYIDMIIKYPHIPGFLIHEISYNPQRLLSFSNTENLNLDMVKQRLQKEIDEGNIIQITPEQLIVNIIGLCVFPFAAKPLVIGLVLDGQDKNFDEFVKQRKTQVADFVVNAIKIK